MSDQRIPISQLSETQTAPDASYIAIDDGSLTKKITVENFNSTSTASAQQYANQAAASAQTVEDNIATSAAQIREATLAAREATQASTAASASATSAYDSAALAQNYSVNAATSAGQAMNAADTVAQGVTESKEYAEDSEAWAVGKRNGTDVPSSDVTYHNNAKYYSDNASSDADRAEAAADSINLPDTTLTVSGVAADSKATGDRISSVNAELVDIRVMANGATAVTAGDAVRDQISALEDVTNQLISNNLAGNEANTPYPVYIPAGTKITVSTSDGSVFPSGGTLRLLLLSADGTQTDYWSLANNATYRTITTNASKADTYYIAWNEQPPVPLMVNFGANADPYVPYVTPITSKVNKLDSAIEGINVGLATFIASWFANEVQAVTAEFVTFYGKKTANNNYKCAKYPVRNGSLKVRVDSIFVYWSSSQYNVFAAYNDSDEFLGGLKNSEVNTTTTGGTYTNVEWDIPEGTSYVLVSFARMSDKTEIPTISEYGYNLPEPNKRIFNQNLSSDFKQQFYFHVATSELGDYNSLAFNAKLVTEAPVEYYDIYFTGYDQDYSGRTFLVYKIGLTKGINGNEIVIAENFQNTANSIKSKYWNGVVLNLKYAASSLESGQWLRSMPLYATTAEYMLLNDTSLELAYYPSSGYTPIIKEYHAPYNPMYGGHLCAIGDSLTGVYYKSASETWSALIAKWNCMEFDNLGISGNPIAKSESYTGGACMAERVDNLDPEKRYTHIFVMGGANDYNLSIPIGTNTDTEITTFKGAVNHIITKLTEKFPMAKIVFGTTYRRVASYADKPYADAMIEVCKLHSIPCLNNYESSGVQFFDANWMAKFGATNQLGNNHLNAAGDMFVAPRIEHALKYGVD